MRFQPGWHKSGVGFCLRVFFFQHLQELQMHLKGARMLVGPQGFYRDLRAFIGTSGAFIGSPQLCSQGAEAGGLALTGESLPSWVSNAAWELGKGERTYAPARPALFVALAQCLDARQGVLCCLVGLCCSIPALLAVPWGCPRDGLYNRVASSRSLLRGGCRVRGHPHQNHPFCTNFQGRELV